MILRARFLNSFGPKEINPKIPFKARPAAFSRFPPFLSNLFFRKYSKLSQFVFHPRNPKIPRIRSVQLRKQLLLKEGEIVGSESPHQIQVIGTNSKNHDEEKKMAVLKRYVLRLFISLKYITANVVDRNNGRIVATASTVEHSIKNSLECGRSCNAKAATVVGEVLAMRLKVEGLEHGLGRGIHTNVNKEIEKKGFKSSTKVWAIVNGLRNNGVKLILDDNSENESQP